MSSKAQKEVCLLFRSSQNKAYSIEEIFKGIIYYLKESNETFRSSFYAIQLEVPEPSSSIIKIIKNIIFTMKIKSDIIHITGDIHYVLPFISKNKKKILTIHDMAALQRVKKTSLKYWIIKYFWYVLPIKFADRISVISDKTRNELLKTLSIDEHKISVITNYVKPIFENSSHKKLTQSPNFLLVGGGLNKNTRRCLLALQSIDNARVTLLGIFNTEILMLLNDLQLNYKVHNNLLHEEVVELYRNCDIVLFPSLYEGFGMPIIEGQAVGRPVITSNISPMCEIAGSGACLVDPEKIDSIRDGILKVLNDEKFRSEITEQGLRNVKKYNIEIISNQYLSIYLS